MVIMKPSKNKQHKKVHKDKERRKSRSKSDSDDSCEWVEVTSSSIKAAESGSKPQRETWMEMASTFIPTISKKEMRKEREMKMRATLVAIDKPGQSNRELNPYWKDGGLGVPMTEETQKQKTSSVGDGGVGWLRKAYYRLKEQAQEQGTTMEELAVERFGSLEKLERMLEEAEEKDGRDHFRRPLSGRDKDRRSGFRRPSDSPLGSQYSRHSRESQNHCRWRKQDATSIPLMVEHKAEASIDDKPHTIKTNDESRGLKRLVMGTENLGDRTDDHRVEEEAEILGEKEMNELGAKLVKAELMGNTDLVQRLKQKLAAARKATEKSQVVLLTQSSARGMTRPFESPGTSQDNHKKHKVTTHDASGKRICYFGDDDKYSLRQMFEKEKFTTADDDTAMFLKMAAKGRTGGDYDFDDLFVDQSSIQESDVKQQEREIHRAIREDKIVSATLENCPRCLDSKYMQKHLIIAMGTKSYLALPGWQSLVEGHCLIVPMTHVAASTLLDEDIWMEMQHFRKHLYQLFRSRGCDTLFLESSMHLRRQPHTFLECLPLPEDDGALAPMYFKKAILESETEWAQNKKLVDTSKKDVRHSVPKGLPYFSVDFGLDGGFAHVIEDEKLFPRYFGTEIVGGILDLEPQLWLKPRNEKFQEQSAKVLQFSQWWKPHDFTT